MKIVNPYYITLDGLNLNTAAHNIEVVTGLKVVPDRRSTDRTIASRHGAEVSDEYFQSRRMRLRVTMFPNDDDGTPGEDGPVADLHAGWDDLVTVIAKRGLIDVRHFVPDEDSESDDSVIELQGDARVRRTVMVDGDAAVWTADVELEFPWPFWHELPKVTLAADTSHSFNSGGTAPVADMVFTFAADGEVSDSLSGHKLGVSGMTGSEVVVDVGRRKVFEDGELAMGLLTVDAPDYWMEWPAQTDITLTASSAVGVEFYRSRF